MKAVEGLRPARAHSAVLQVCFASCNAVAASALNPSLAAFGKVHAAQALPGACAAGRRLHTAPVTYVVRLTREAVEDLQRLEDFLLDVALKHGDWELPDRALLAIGVHANGRPRR